MASGAFIVAGCGADDPTRFGRPPVVQSFSPADRIITAFVGDTLQFSLRAMDPDRDPIATTFTVDGARVAKGIPWTYVIEDTGYVTVRASVSDGQFVSYIDWVLERRMPINHPPVISAFLPVDPNPILIIGNSMAFALVASDLDGDALSYSFTVDDSLVASSRQFTYQAAGTGVKLVRGIVSDGEHSAAHAWNLRVTLVPDTIAPALVEITDARTGDEPGEVLLEWIAVGRDGMSGRATEYQVRTAPVPILTEQDWKIGSQRPGVPEPAFPGEPMAMVVGGLLPAHETYLAVRALDDFGNISPLGASPLVVTRGMHVSGTVVNTITGEPVDGVTVRIGLFSTTTHPDGTWGMDELPYIDDSMNAGDAAASGYGAYFDVAFPYRVQHLSVTPIYLIPNRTLTSQYYTSFLQFFRSMTDIAGHPYGTQQRRWQLPIDLYVRPYERDGLDYRAVIGRVAEEFDAILGTKVFNVSVMRSGVGVETAYVDGLPQDKYGVREWTSDWYPLLGMIEFRTVYTPASAVVLERTIRHELGHALGLGHSADIAHLMVGGVAPQVNYFSDDEIAVLRSLYRIPRGFDNRNFLYR